MRVSIEARSPPTSASVGVWMRGAESPAEGIASSAALKTCSPGTAEVAATSRSSRRAMPSTSYWPGFLNGMSATYTDFAAFGSVAVWRLWNCGLTSSDS